MDHKQCGHCKGFFQLDWNNRHGEIGCGSENCGIWWCSRACSKKDGYYNDGDAYEPGDAYCNHCKRKPKEFKKEVSMAPKSPMVEAITKMSLSLSSVQNEHEEICANLPDHLSQRYRTLYCSAWSVVEEWRKVKK